MESVLIICRAQEKRDERISYSDRTIPMGSRYASTKKEQKEQQNETEKKGESSRIWQFRCREHRA